jgi:uncharacterized protein
VSPVGPVVVDTGILLAAADADDDWYERAASLLRDKQPGQLVLPAPVAIEAAWLIASRLGPRAAATFIASIAAGDFSLTDLAEEDWARCAWLTEQYLDLDLGLVDASVVAVAERLGVTTVASVDRRDLLVVRPAQ